MTVDHGYKIKNQLTSEGAGYYAKNVSVITEIFHQKLKHFVNHMPIYQKDTKNQEDDTNTAQNEETQVQVNATLKTSNIKELVKSIMK